jgi:hypothetical protein
MARPAKRLIELSAPGLDFETGIAFTRSNRYELRNGVKRMTFRGIYS